jgi:hypothetical protein
MLARRIRVSSLKVSLALASKSISFRLSALIKMTLLSLEVSFFSINDVVGVID